MAEFPEDIFTEPEEVDHDTLKNLGFLAADGGIWEGQKSLDVNLKAAGLLEQVYVERIELQPTDPQANGPQLFYGLRQHTASSSRTRSRPITTRSAIGCGSP